MATATLDMNTTEADKVIVRIMYRKEKATRLDIEESFRRSVDSAGKSVSRLLNGSLGRLVRNGNLRKLKGDKFKFLNGKMA